jgi:hypothetical protein
MPQQRRLSFLKHSRSVTAGISFARLREYVTTFLARMRAQIRKASQALAPLRQEDTLEKHRKVAREALEQARQWYFRH